MSCWAALLLRADGGAMAGVHAHADRADGGDCSNPRTCVNACAAKCLDRQSAVQCCEQFWGYGREAWDACMRQVNEVWPQ